MPRANPNVVGAQVTMLILPKTEGQEFKIDSVKDFTRNKIDKKTNETVEVWGLRYVFTVVGGPHDGKPLPVEFYFHSEGSFGFNKRLLMAAKGYEMSQAGEEKFNNDHKDIDFAVDTDEHYIAPVWKDIVGGRIKADVDKAVYQGKDTNSFTWYSFV